MEEQETALLEQVKGWIRSKKPEYQDVDLDLDLDLLENRIIDSLGFVDFVFFLERITGREINVETAHPFRTLRAIRENILCAAEGAGLQPIQAAGA